MALQTAKRHDGWPVRRPTRPTYGSSAPAETVIGSAVLVVTAFRLRDPDGLATALRLLATAVTDWEESERVGG